MEIKTITRLVSDYQYGHLSMTAELKEGENIEQASIKLDEIIRKTLKKIDTNVNMVVSEKQETDKAISILEDVIRKARRQSEELPF